MKGAKKILWVVLAVALMLGYVWMRMVNNKLTERVADLQQQTEILNARLEREQIELNKHCLVTELERRAQELGLCYPWEEHGAN
ncbi:hypothetical protein JXM67_06790 [candidate division WOR-3 bacterium]|nr:hypothetical protein [candidate division WOR-3 bacterium]